MGVLTMRTVRSTFVVPTTPQSVDLKERTTNDDVDEKDDAKSTTTTTTTTVETSSTSPPITRISLIGERNSGTNWMYVELLRCFNGTSLKPHHSLTRFKHWFQDEEAATNRNHTVVIAQFRSPYTWVDAMRRKPHHAPAHMNRRWKDFVTKPWTMERVGADLAIPQEHRETNSTFRCQERFRYRQIVSCVKHPYPEGHFTWKRHWSEHQPSYEMRRGDNDDDDESDASVAGESYNNILELRRDKIRNFLGVGSMSFVRDVLVVNYERLVREGTGFVVRHVEQTTGVKARCQPYPPQSEREPRPLKPQYVDWITDHADWETEALIGYEKWKRGATYETYDAKYDP